MADHYDCFILEPWLFLGDDIYERQSNPELMMMMLGAEDCWVG